MSRIFHCFFEQSGTFKNEFRKLGYEAYDYDILNDFGETDYQIDLFNEIEKGYVGEKSIFDNIKQEDYILAFFPCTRFEAIIPLKFRGEAIDQKNWDTIKKLEYSIKLQSELTELYILLSKLVIIVERKKLQMIIENPYTQPHYLTTYWCLRPTLIDKDRTIRGDYYKKPTQYWFINCKPTYRPLFESQVWQEEKKIVADTHTKVERSLISKEYANRFIREFIL